MDNVKSRASPLEKVQNQIRALQLKVAFLSEENKQLKQTIKELNKLNKSKRSRHTETEIA